MNTILLWIAAVLPGGATKAVDFDNHIIPVLTKAGCNTGACHGAAVGRGGFKLSLYGGDPENDYRSIALELEGRRVNLTHPEESLFVLKPTESIAHGGGYRLEDDGAGADLLRRWVREGAERTQTQHLDHFQVAPERHVAERVGESVVLSANGKFSDGSNVDVTQWTVFTAEDPSAVEIDPETARATLLRRGRHVVIARYLDHVVPLEIIVPLSDVAIDFSASPRHNFIDDRVLELLSTLRIPVSGETDDASFLRRVTLDLTGRLPSLEMLRDFLASDDSHKRQAVVDQLLVSPEFTEYWTLQLAQLLRIRPQPGDARGAQTYHQWLKQSIAEGMPYDQLARAVLTASGDTHEVGPANFYRTVAGAREQAEFASELFMGSRLRCANCHNHPLDRWTQDDYHGLAAIFAKVESGRVIKLASRGEITHPRTGEPAVPRIPGERFLDTASAAADSASNASETAVDGRAAFASWLTDHENPYFAKAIVNRLWKALMGRGLIEPTDDLRATNPATHPRLLEQLAQDFVEHGYDLRHTLRRIAASATYARSAHALVENYADERYYSHAFTRPLQPEVLLDAISDVTGVSEVYGEQPLGTRSVSLFDASIKSEALDILGRCSREESCETSASASGGLSRALHLFNGELLNRRLVDQNGRIVQGLAEGHAPLNLVDEFYLRALGRSPSAAEQAHWLQQLSGLKDEELQAGLEDFVWSLLACREFVTNH